ncbi:hypothetical protein, conserved [Babesia bigemina]|uniref:Uncharacterized protein n=1 Tax=Babesia bigemina TaxID=5866 RepID=A0A061D438_BABBI|nr:hypothetical protein, conserved [Babesia bigemina]CDR95511.1 hypothetical protein, conserved [Babesia bigemina]|eukprot:XP_012767697.1 hypothetical protein, conserved [Babesia bigemina]
MLALTYRLMAAKRFVPMVPYGVKISRSYRESKRQQRIAMETARKQREMKGMLLDTRKTLLMSLRDNTGINWYRATQILKHLEVHRRHPSGATQAWRDKITKIAETVKSQR